MRTTAQELLQELNNRGISLYLKNNWITTRDTLTDGELMRLSKCAQEMRQLLKGAEIGREAVIGPVSGHESEYWGTTRTK